MLETNIPKLKGVLIEKGITHEMLAKEIGVDKSTFSRKISSDGLKFSVDEVHKIAKILNLSQSDAVDIFLHEYSQ